MTRRPLLAVLCALGLAPKASLAQGTDAKPKIEPLTLPDAEWKKRLTPAQYDVLRHEAPSAPAPAR